MRGRRHDATGRMGVNPFHFGSAGIEHVELSQAKHSIRWYVPCSASERCPVSPR